MQVSAPPEKGKANDRLRKVLAKALGVRASQVEVVQGKTSRRKVARVCDVEPENVAKILAGKV